MVVVTADHGVSYRPGLSRRGPTPENGSDIAGVPLFIKYPHERRGHVDNSMVENIDVVPTIADRLGARLPWKADGRPIGGDRAARTLVQVGSGGHVFTLPFTSFVHDRRAGLRRMVSLFGSDDGGAGLYAAGAGGELIGRDVRSLRLSAGTGSTLELDSAEALDHFRPDSRLVPSFVTGRVTGGTPAGTQVAIAVNGRVRGTSETFQDGEDVRIAGFVPPSSFRSGSNSLDVFAVAGPAGSRHLARIATQRPDAYRLVQDGEGVRIVGGTQTARVQPGALEGYVDVLEKDDQGVRLGGWAVDLQGRRPAERVVVFDGTRLVAQGRLTTERPDIVQRYGSDRVARSGYEVRGSAKGAELDHLRVFALSGDRATELPHFKR
jgi:hypothetical protein